MMIVGLIVGLETDGLRMKITAKNMMTLPDGKHRIEQNFYLDVRHGGTKRIYVLRYTFNGRRREMSLGSPEVKPLTIAKREASKFKTMIASGIDPIADREEQKEKVKATALTVKKYFESVSEEILRLKQYKRENFEVDQVKRMRVHVLPSIGNRPISQITSADIADMLRPLWGIKTPTCMRILSHLVTLFDLARRDGVYSGSNPAVWRGGLSAYFPSFVKTHRPEHRKAPTVDMLKKDLPTLLIPGKYNEIGFAVMFGAMSAGRRIEWSMARWEEVDLEKRTLSISPERRKDGKQEPFVIPLSDQMVWILNHQKPRESGMVFQSKYRNSVIRPDSISDAVRRISNNSYCLHGFRSTFRDWAAENGIDRVVAEKCLCHAVGSYVESCYQRSDLLELRRPVIQRWSDEIVPMDVLLKFQEEEEALGVDVETFRHRVINVNMIRQRNKKQDD